MRVLIVGLDGATWTVLKDLMGEGKLSFLKRIVENGSYGYLESTIPPVTGAAWPAMATGKNPGKTGIVDHIVRKGREMRLHPIGSWDVKGQCFWDFLSLAGYKVGIFNYPLLYPPYEINGFMVSGLGTLRVDDASFPPELMREIKSVVGDYEIYLNYHDKKYDDADLLIRDLNRFMDKFERAAYYVVENKEWDMLFLVVSATDWIQHAMWEHIDPEHPLYDPERSPRYREKFVKFWQRIDKFLERLYELAGRDTIMFIVSDHGFGPSYQTFNLARWLCEKKFMVVKKSRIKSKLKRAAFSLAKVIAKTPLKKYIPLNVRKRVRRSIRASIADLIDFDKSVAFCLGHTIVFGAIYLSPKLKGEEKERIAEEILGRLKNVGEDLGRKIEVEAYRSCEIYSGPKIDLLPEIVFTINGWKCVVVENDLRRPIFEDAPFSSRRTGSHRPLGIFAAYGPGVRKSFDLGVVKIYDVAPTVLHIFGLPIPRDVDGRVLMELFEEGSEYASREPRLVDDTYYRRFMGKLYLRDRIRKIKAKKLRKHSR